MVNRHYNSTSISPLPDFELLLSYILFLHMLLTPQYISLIFVLNNYLLMISDDAVGWSQSESLSVMSKSLRPHGLHSPWNSPGQNTGVGSLSFLQGIFPTQGSSPGLPHCRRILYQLSHKGSPRILEWVAYPFSRGSSQPRNRTGVSCIAGRFFINWAIRECQLSLLFSHTEEHSITSLLNWLSRQWLSEEMKC